MGEENEVKMQGVAIVVIGSEVDGSPWGKEAVTASRPGVMTVILMAGLQINWHGND